MVQLMVIRCVRCGAVVSSNLPDDAKVEAWVECRKCVNAEVFSDRVVFQQVTINGIKLKMFEFFMKCKFKGLDLDTIRKIINESLDGAIKSKFTKDGYFEKLQSESEILNLMRELNKVVCNE